MKRFILICCILFSCTAAFASLDDHVVWIKDLPITVTTSPNSVVYEMSTYRYFEGRVRYNLAKRDVVDYSSCKAKKWKKPVEVIVRGYANRVRQMAFDTYVVESNGKLYFLEKEYCADNSVIDGVNGELAAKYAGLNQSSVDMKAELDSLVTYHTSLFTEERARQLMLKEKLPSIIDSVKNQAAAQYKANEQSRIDKWYSTLPASTKNAYSKIAISEARLGSPNSASGCNYVFTYTNRSKKTIKYLYWTGSFYNAVNDPVTCDIRDYNTYTGKDTGPVAPGEDGGGIWECVIYNWSADHVKLSNVSITYMDGTTTTISAADVRRLTTQPSSVDYYLENGSEYTAVENAIKPYEKQLSDCNVNIRALDSRLSYLSRGNFEYPLYFDTGEYESVFNRISELYVNLEKVKRSLEEFEYCNMLVVRR